MDRRIDDILVILLFPVLVWGYFRYWVRRYRAETQKIQNKLKRIAPPQCPNLSASVVLLSATTSEYHLKTQQGYSCKLVLADQFRQGKLTSETTGKAAQDATRAPSLPKPPKTKSQMYQSGQQSLYSLKRRDAAVWNTYTRCYCYSSKAKEQWPGMSVPLRAATTVSQPKRSPGFKHKQDV